MNPLSVAGAFVITISLLSYGVGNITLQRFKMVTPGVLWFLSLGVVLDIIASIFMIIGSRYNMFTLHSLLGYSAMLAMIVEVSLIWRVYFLKRNNAVLNKKLLTLARLTYGWWIAAYITGSLLVIWK